MPTYNGWNIVTMPSTPSAKSIEFGVNNIVAASTNPFTGAQQIQDWNARYLEANVTMPPMTAAQAADWVTFLLAAKGPACVFQLPALIASLVPSGAVPGTYWRMKDGTQKWSVNEAMVYGLQFEIREAI